MSPGLPIAEGAWVDAKTRCASTQEAWVYSGASFGDATLYAHSGGKLDPLDTLVRVKDGFVRINGGPWEIKSLPDGRAILRSFSNSEGEIDRRTLRRCELATLPPALRLKIEPALAAGPRQTVYVAGRANGRWSMAAEGGGSAAQYAGDGLIETLSLTCLTGAVAGPDKVRISARLRKAAPVTATRLALVYVDGGTPATSTAAYHLAAENLWIGPADDGIVDTLSISNRIIIDMGPAGAEDIPLTGSGAALREALAPCWRSRR